MATEIGRLEKPAAEPYRSARKLYLVPLVLFGEKSPPELQEKCRRYWAEVKEHLANLEAKIGKVKHVFHESIVVCGEEGLKAVQQFNPDAWEIARDRIATGATFDLTEDRHTAEEAMDWERCLMLGFMSETVASKVTEFHAEALRRRYDFIARRVDESLKPGEAGLIFIREGHRVQFPADVEVFLVFPPSLDDIHRWLRDQVERSQQQPPAPTGEPAGG